MVQTKDDCLAFLAEARNALDELSLISDQEKQLQQEEVQLERRLEAEKRAVAENIRLTIKHRAEELSSNYDKEITKGQEKLKRARSRREKAKSQGVKDRIAEETQVLCEHNQELRLQMKSTFQQSHVPAYCRTSLYYSLYFPRWFREFLTLLAAIALFFLLIPCGIYFLIPNRSPFYLVIIYLLDILIVGGIYVVVGNRGRMLHMETLKAGRAIRDQIHSNDKKIHVITSTIRKDRNESLYNLGKYDDEIAQAEQELSDVASKKKEALTTFETVTKTIISDEIEHNSKAKLDALETDFERAGAQLKEIEAQRKEKRLLVTDRFGTYLGNDFLDPLKIAELIALIQNGEAQNLSEAMGVYKDKG